MRQYFYIPVEHDDAILPAIDAWTAQPHNGWTIITGVYKQEGYTAGNSIVYNVNVLRVKEFILLGIQNTELNITKTLTAFCLEGDLDYYAPEFKAQLLALEGVLAFNSNGEYLTYIDSL